MISKDRSLLIQSVVSSDDYSPDHLQPYLHFPCPETTAIIEKDADISAKVRILCCLKAPSARNNRTTTIRGKCPEEPVEQGVGYICTIQNLVHHAVQIVRVLYNKACSHRKTQERRAIPKSPAMKIFLFVNHKTREPN